MESLVEKGNKDPNVFLTLGGAHFRDSNALTAEKIYQRGIEINPDSVNFNLTVDASDKLKVSVYQLDAIIASSVNNLVFVSVQGVLHEC